MNSKKTRTLTQNRALHLYFRQLAETLNNAGLDAKKRLEIHDVDIPWSETLVKELIWSGVQEAMLGTTSTTKLDTSDVAKVYEVINRYLSTTFGVSLEFPSEIPY